LFGHGDQNLPLWHALTPFLPSIHTRANQVPQELPPTLYAGPTLRAWQREAFVAWREAGHRGIVEAVTGTGKTAVGIFATAYAVSRGLRTLIIVPGRDLLDQWYDKLVKELPSLKIGRFGDVWKDSLRQHHVVVSTVQSAYRRSMLPSGLQGLLIADEVHRYGADEYAKALDNAFKERLGLTATYEREDNGVERHLTPYFSPQAYSEVVGSEVVASCGYARGLADGILAHFRVGFVGVSLTSVEQRTYEEFDAQVKRTRASLIYEYNCPKEPFGEFMKVVTQFSEGDNGDAQATRIARQYLHAFNKRRSLLADSERKVSALEMLSPVLALAKRALVFTETINSAKRSAEALRERGVSALDYTSELDRDGRRERLSCFRSGIIKVLAAPRMLDEGIDVPEADVGVIVAASRSRRQMIQRMGRIIRPKADDQPATFVVLYVRGTSEDPELGAHGVFLSEMMDNADDVQVFPASVDASQLLTWHLAR